MMNTWSPTWARSELPIRATIACAGTFSSCSSETSASGSEATTRAPTTWPSRNSAVIWSAVCTTWAAVMTLPSGVISTPEPTSLTRPTWPPTPTSFHFARMMTTDALTRRNAGPRLCACAGGAAGTRRTSDSTVDQPAERVEIEGGGLAGRSAGLGLESGLAQDHADGGVGVERLRDQQAAEHREGRHAGGPGPDALGACEQALGLEDLVVLRVTREAAALLQDA